MKKLLALAAAAAGVVFALKRKKKGQSSTDVWQQATRPQS
jgi:hypothetical protein